MNGNRTGVPTVIVSDRPGCLLQLLWFVFIGWWLGLAAIGFAYVMFIFVVTIPIGVAVLNRVPELIALRPAPRPVTPYGSVHVPQVNIVVRALWFVLVGWWLAGMALAVGYALCLTFVGIPFGFLLFDATPTLLTLHRTT
jgi:uncharacterized membrane protein YccF (DUF307 family)